MTNSLLDNANAGLASLSPYEPGRPIEEIEREYGLSAVIKLASNENPLGPCPRARAAAQAAMAGIHMYPDGNGFVLKQKLAAAHDIDPARITLGNGSNDMLQLLGQVFLGPGRNAVMADYAFAIYKLVALGMNAEPVAAPALAADEEMAYGHDPAALLDAVTPDTRLLFIANPNNPTGTWLAPDAIEDAIARAPAHVIVVLDEAYREYLDPVQRPVSRAWLDRYPNLVVTRTFSKAYGLAGLRCGYMLSSPELSDLINRVRQPFNVNSVAMAAAVAALDDRDYLDKVLTLNAEQMPLLRRGLDALGCPALPSQTNFLTFDCGGDCRAVHEALLRQGVIVRAMAGYGMPRHLRVTTGKPQENERFLQALKQVLSTA